MLFVILCRSLHLRSLLQTGTGTAAAAVGPTTAISSSAAGAGDNNNFVGAAQQVLNSPQTQLAAKQASPAGQRQQSSYPKTDPAHCLNLLCLCAAGHVRDWQPASQLK